jgi:murein DD-endopeptidase MepM/ murein hydrolase activator NlpD
VHRFILILSCFIVFLALSQTPKKKPQTKKPATGQTTKKKPVAKKPQTKSGSKNTDIKRVAAPKIVAPKKAQSTPTQKVKATQKVTNDSLAGETPEFGVDGTPRNELNVASEDTSTIDDNLGETEIMETEEQIKIDSEWVKIAEEYEYMEDWSTNRVNPYNFDPHKMEKTAFLIIDSANGRHWSKPIKRCYMTSDFGQRWGRWHYGLDLALTTGDSVGSVFDGLVRVVGWDPRGYGNFIVVRHYNGLETVYGHMSKTYAKIGDYVKAGDLIGFGGSTGRSTGPHLHFEVRYAGQAIDPKFFFDFSNCELIKKSCFISAENFEYQKIVRRIYYHKIRTGDNLGKIARKYGVSIKQLCRLNRISTKTKLRVGRRLRVR